MKRRITITVQFEVNADSVDPTVSPDGWDYRFARIEDEARLSLLPVVTQALGAAVCIGARSEIGRPYDPDNEPF